MSLRSLLAVSSCCYTLTISSSAIEPPPEISQTETGFNLDWDGQTGRTYFIEYSDDLMSWAYMPVVEYGGGNPIGYGFSVSGERLFLRLKYTDTPTSDAENDDFDNDGFTNIDEVTLYGSDPFENSDTDSDGMIDAWEMEQFGNLLQLASGDFDSDGIKNKDEFLHGLDPLTDDSQQIGNQIEYMFEFNRLIGADYNTGLNLNFTYDANFNITGVSEQ